MKSFKKLFLSGLLALSCGMLMLTSCSKSSDLAKFIPDDAIVVVNADMNTLWEKIDVDNIDNISFIKLARQELRSEDPKIADLIDNIIKDPTATGLNLKKDVSFYVTMQGSSFLCVMNKASKFEDFLQDFAQSQGEKVEITKKDGYKVASIDGIELVVFNNDVAAMGQNPDISLKLDKKNSMVKNKNYNEYWKNHGELSCWLNMGKVLDLANMFGGDVLKESGAPQEIINAMKEGSYSMNLFFDKGVVRLAFEMQGVDPKVWKDYEKKFNADLIKYMPEKSYIAFAAAVNMEQLVKAFENSKEDIDLNEKIAGDKTVKDLLLSFDGSFVISVFDWVANKETSVMPMFAIATEVKDAATLKQMLGEAGLTQKDGLYVVPDFGMGVEVYIALTDKVAYVTNSDAAAKQFLAGGYKDGMKDIAKKAKEGNYIYADLNLKHYPQAVTSLIPEGIVNLLSGYLEYTEALNTSKTTGEWDFYLTDKKENSLLYTLHYIDQHLVELGNLAEMFPSPVSDVEVEDLAVTDEDMEYEL